MLAGELPHTMTDIGFSWPLRAMAERHSGKAAIVAGGRTMTYSDLLRRFDVVAAALRDSGVQAGDRVAICIEDKADFLSTLFGVICGGGIAVVVDRQEASEQRDLLYRVSPRCVIHDKKLAISADAVPAARFFDVAALTAAASPRAETHATDAAMILFTSGTEGRRKGVIVTHGNLSAITHYMNTYQELRDEAVELVTAPIEHAFGLGRCRNLLMAGATVVLDTRPFSPARVLSLFSKAGCNAISSVSTGYAMLLQNFPQQLGPLRDRLRWAEIGSQPLHLEHVAALRDLAPTACLMMNYGMTEAQRSTLVDLNRFPDRDCGVGPASPGCAVRVTGDDGAPKPPGELGIIEVCGPHIAAGYWDDEAAWRGRFRDGWLQTDDVGLVDSRGFLHYRGRRDEMINVGGDKVPPAAIEAVASSLWPSAIVAVCGVADPVYGEVPLLCFEGELPAGFEWPVARRQLLERLPGGWVPRSYRVSDRFPRTGNGKLQRSKLAKIAVQRTG